MPAPAVGLLQDLLQKTVPLDPRSYPADLVILGYTKLVKTAISIPDDVFNRATRVAATLGLSRSALFTQAVERYLQHVEAESLTREIDTALERIGCTGSDDSASVAVDAGRRRLAADAETW
jgi:predicted DNA-binding protein